MMPLGVRDKMKKMNSLTAKGGRKMSKPRVSVTSEAPSGRNQTFHDNRTGRNMNRQQFVRSIEIGNYEHYHVREINGIKTPVSNPDKSTNNNLG